jgi:hypothetical protein
LTWPDDAGHEERIEIFKTLEFLPILDQLAQSPDIDVRDRARTALAHFNNVSSMTHIVPSTPVVDTRREQQAPSGTLVPARQLISVVFGNMAIQPNDDPVTEADMEE